jgi:hypothetical protein
MIEALMTAVANREKTNASERQKAESREKFIRRPKSLEWCSRYTPTEKQCEKIMEALKVGNEEPLKEARADGLEFAGVDYANGRVIPVYALCMWKNDGQCRGFKSRSEK